MDFIERNTDRPPAEDPPTAAAVAASSPPPPPPPASPPPPAAANGTSPRPLTSIEKLMARAAVQAGDNPSAITPPRPASQPPARPAAAAAAPAASVSEPRVESEASRASAPAPSPVATTPKLESIALDILHELRRRHEQPQQDFSVSKLLAGITQVLVLAILFVAFLNRNSPIRDSILLTALTFQAMTIALLIMQRQR
jgi:hypothetical protein